MGITCGIDWAERHHDVALVDDTGRTVGKKRIDTGLNGFTELLALIAEHGGEPDASTGSVTDSSPQGDVRLWTWPRWERLLG